jgi:hypothetical protein
MERWRKGSPRDSREYVFAHCRATERPRIAVGNATNLFMNIPSVQDLTGFRTRTKIVLTAPGLATYLHLRFLTHDAAFAIKIVYTLYES